MKDNADIFLTALAQKGIESARAVASIVRWGEVTLLSTRAVAGIEGSVVSNDPEWLDRIRNARVERWRETETVASLLGVLLNWLDDTGREPAYENPRRQLAALRQEANRLLADVTLDSAVGSAATSRLSQH